MAVRPLPPCMPKGNRPIVLYPAYFDLGRSRAAGRRVAKKWAVESPTVEEIASAAKALGLVIPEMRRIGFLAESVRIPTSTGSLIVLVVTLEDESMKRPIKREAVNQVYQKASETYMQDYLLYTDRQNVSSDIIGNPRAAAIIEGHETHTRTAEQVIDLETVPGLEKEILNSLKNVIIRIPITQAVVYGWYDNELGSYTNMLGDRTVSMAEMMV